MCYFQIYETNKQLDSPRWKDGWIQPIKSPVLEEAIFHVFLGWCLCQDWPQFFEHASTPFNHEHVLVKGDDA